MKSTICTMVSVVLLLTLTGGAHAAPADISGVTPGKWTMDFDAAKKKAQATKLPILVNFSGSDWCGWCKLMEKNVFSKDKWKAYAKENILMVLIDFPKDSSLVPGKYIERNKTLKQDFNVEGFPSFIVLDSDGETELGRLGAGQDKTPDSFATEVKGLTRYSAPEVAKYTETLSAKDRAAYEKVIKQISGQKRGIAMQKKQIAAAQGKIEELEKGISELEAAAQELRVAQLGPQKLKEYKALKTKKDAAQKKLMDWLATGPQRTEENGKKFQAMSEELQELSSQLARY